MPLPSNSQTISQRGDGLRGTAARGLRGPRSLIHPSLHMAMAVPSIARIGVIASGVQLLRTIGLPM
jgi:hypothetical protein